LNPARDALTPEMPRRNIVAGRGGLRAKVIEGGTIRARDGVLTEDPVNFLPRGESDVRAFAHDNTHPSEGT